MTILLRLVLEVSWFSTSSIVWSNALVLIQMWYFGSKCWRIRTSINANCKQLKVVLASKVRNFGLASVASKIVKFSLFDDFFPDLAKFWYLNVFSLFDFLDLNEFSDLNNFPDFLACCKPFPPILNPSTLPLLVFFLEAGLLLFFLL